MPSPGSVHHIELYVTSLEASARFWEGLLGTFGYVKFQEWEQGLSYKLDDTYIVMVQVAPEHIQPSYHRKRVGLNHLALHAASRSQVDEITSWVKCAGYTVLYEDRHPFCRRP